MLNSKTIRLFWWSETQLMGKSKENYGDLIGKYLVEKISKKKVIWVHPKYWNFKDCFQPIYVTVGSVLAHVNKKCIVWGSGIIYKDQNVRRAKYLAVRGPQTRLSLLRQGYEVPEIFGDPALLLPNYYYPVKNKIYSVGIVPHYTDYNEVYDLYKNSASILVINLMTNDVEATTDSLLQCERIISSSLHGLIVSHAYGIPAIWIEFSEKLFGDGIKFQDYFESVGIESYKPRKFSNCLTNADINKCFSDFVSLPNAEILENCKQGLISVCPFL